MKEMAKKILDYWPERSNRPKKPQFLGEMIATTLYRPKYQGNIGGIEHSGQKTS